MSGRTLGVLQIGARQSCRHPWMMSTGGFIDSDVARAESPDGKARG